MRTGCNEVGQEELSCERTNHQVRLGRSLIKGGLRVENGFQTPVVC